MAINWQVSREEYDSTLRSSVNAYYEHAINDPTMSQEEALQTTAEMAENYENAMAEFDAAAAKATEEAGNETGEVSDSEETLDGGEDGGEDGGME